MVKQDFCDREGCGGKFYHYKYLDNRTLISICYKCGRYIKSPDTKDAFWKTINKNPPIILQMIKNKQLIPIL